MFLIRRKKTTVLAVAVPALVVLAWVRGPAPLWTCPYVQQVTTTSAVIVRIDDRPRRTRLVLFPGPHECDHEDPRIQTEDAPRLEHVFSVTGLAPATRYRFRIEDLGADGGTRRVDEGGFRTASCDDASTVQFAAVGDSGYQPWFGRVGANAIPGARAALAFAGGLGRQWEVAARMSQQDLDFFMHLGDMVYPTGAEKDYREGFFLPFEQVLRKAGMFAVLGNHDVMTRSGEPYLRIFHLPTNPATGDERFYTFASGPLRIVSLDTSSSDTAPSSSMGRWLEQTLAAAPEPWVVVAMHHWIFSATAKRDRVNQKLEEDLLPVLTRHGVDLVLTGHDHNYQRFKPVGGVVQIVAGGGGKSLYDLRADPRVDAMAQAFGFLHVKIAGARLSGAVVGLGGEPLDTFVLDRKEEIERGDWCLNMDCARCARLGPLLGAEACRATTCRHVRP